MLEQALKLRKRNLHVEQKMLLAARIALPIILALCLARPVMSMLSQIPGLSKSSLVVILDDSASMRAMGDSGATRDRALAELRRILEKLPGGSDVSVVLAGSPARLLLDSPTTTLDIIPEKIQNLPFLSGPLALNDAFQLASSELNRMGGGSKEVLLISDFQKHDWQGLLQGGSLPALDALKNSTPAPLLTFYQTTGQLANNLALTSVEPSAFIVTREQPISFRARIQNYGKRDYQDIPVHLEANGARIRSTRVSVAPESETIFTISHSFDQPGSQAVTLRVEGDAYPEDNTFSMVIPVRERVETLLVKGKSGVAAMTGATDFLELALAPHQSAAAGLKDLIQTRVVEWNRFHHKDIGNTEVIILSNVEKLNGHQMETLDKFVKAGGGLIIFPGPDNDQRWYQNEFYKDGKGLLPAKPDGFTHIDTGKPAARVAIQRHTHPATSYFNDARGLSLQDATFNHWQKFAELRDGARALLSLDHGDPLLIEKTYGDGRVILFSTTATAQWGNLPLQPAFVPLMQRLVTHLATRSTSTAWQRTGAPLQIPLAEDQIANPPPLIDPLNTPHQLEAQKSGDDRYYLSYPSTALPGIYEWRITPPQRFAFNLDTQESNLLPLTTEEAKQTAERLGASYASDYTAFERLDRSRRLGSELWQPFLLIVLFLLFAEVFLQQRIARA